MYRLKYRKYQTPNGNLCRSIESVTIDKRDIEMMRYSEYFELKLAYLMFMLNRRIRGVEKEEYTISDTSSMKRRVINAILECRWLVNADSIKFNDYLKDIREMFSQKLNNPDGPVGENDPPVNEHPMLLNYFIKTYDNLIEKREEKAK